MKRMRRWLFGLAILGVACGVIYTGGYYYVTAEWPWQHDQSAAEMILNDAAPPIVRATSVLPSAPQATAAHDQGQRTPTVHDSRNRQVPAILPPTVAPANTTQNTLVVSSEQHGVVQQGSIHSTFMQGDLPYLIYLPPGYNDTSNAHTRYPVVYLLHGAPGNFDDWNTVGGANTLADALISKGRIPPMLIVMPEGETNFQHDSEWANGTPPALQAESYLAQEVVPFIDAHYRTLAAPIDRAVGGLSTGGYGGVNTALHHPDLFGTAFGLSGNYLAVKTLLGRTLFTDAASVAYNSPITYLKTMANPQQVHLYLAVGTSDRLDNTLVETQQMERELVALNVPHLAEYDEGAHSWQFWSTHLARALQYFASIISNNVT